MNKLVNFALFQLGWFASVLLGASQYHWLGPVVVFAILFVHLRSSQDREAERRLIGYALLIGLVWENLLSLGGLIVYPSGQPFGILAPVWIIAMWPLLAITLNVSLRWLKALPAMAALFGAIGGPLAFLAGERLGAAVFPNFYLAMAALAVGWAILFPVLMYLAARHDGFRLGLEHRVEVLS
jgi:hypothetical protein